MQLWEGGCSDTATVNQSICPLCPTIWTVRTGAISAVLQNYEVLQETFEDTHRSTHDRNGITGGGMISLMDKFSTFFGLKLSHYVFGPAELASKALQAVELNSQEARVALNIARIFYQDQKEPAAFEDMYSETVAQAQGKTEEPKVSRQKKPRRFLEDRYLPAAQFHTPKAFHRQEFLTAVELLEKEVERRADQTSLTLVSAVEGLLPNSAKGDRETVTKIAKSVADLYGSDFNFVEVPLQLKILPKNVKACKVEQKPRSYSDVTIRAIADLFAESSIAARMMPDVEKLLRIYLAVPVRSATAEKTFSFLRRLKNYLRETMSQERLNNLLLLHIHKDRTDIPNMYKIAEEFAGANSRRRKFFGHFI